jgi:L-rhamnose isomerase
MLRRPLSVILNFTFIGILSATVSGLAIAEPDSQSARYWLPHCQHAAKGEFYQGNPFMNGSCAGLIAGLAFMGQLVDACIPESATPEQLTRVVVQYLDQHPARTNENFKALAVEAMREAWPCNH